jgi:hypothetical protein
MMVAGGLWYNYATAHGTAVVLAIDIISMIKE